MAAACWWLARHNDIPIPGLRAIAVPILDIQGGAALVTTAIATGTFPRDEDDTIRSKLQVVCRSLTERVGASWPMSQT